MDGYIVRAHIAADPLSVHQRGWIGDTPMHWASESKPDAVQMLIDRGAQVDSRNVLETSDFHGATPLIMNARQRDDCSEVTTVLLEAGADIHAQGAKGKTALARALEKNLKRIPDVLRQHGATD